MTPVPRQLAIFALVLALLFALGYAAGQLVGPTTGGDDGGMPMASAAAVLGGVG